MLVKLLGSLLILFAGGYGGFMMAKRCADRPDNLRQILSCIVALKSYMSYTALPLSESLAQCAAGANRQVAAFFLALAGRLQENYLMTPRAAMREALALHRGRLALAEADCELMELFGCNLGSMNKAEQENYLTMIERRLEILEREATALRDRNCKMYRYLGVCGSLMVILLLV